MGSFYLYDVLSHIKLIYHNNKQKIITVKEGIKKINTKRKDGQKENSGMVKISYI